MNFFAREMVKKGQPKMNDKSHIENVRVPAGKKSAFSERPKGNGYRILRQRAQAVALADQKVEQFMKVI